MPDEAISERFSLSWFRAKTDGNIQFLSADYSKIFELLIQFFGLTKIDPSF
ncbi:MAG: hypothetical protein GY858_04700 [Candidatus Omnitrophica bacterium]|nr:hypothetical protein [Candidatus Omnitrophota bacterium]